VHGAYASVVSSSAGDAEFGYDASLDYNRMRLRWYDAFLKNMENGLGDEGPVKLFVIGTGDGRRVGISSKMFHGGYWREEREWPLPQTEYTPYYLHGDGGLSPAKPSAGPNATTYQYNPKDPVPTIGGHISAADPMMSPGGYDQVGDPKRFFGCRDHLPLNARGDVVSFVTEPLAEDLLCIGPLTFKFWASSSAVDTDFTAKLIDWYPPNADFPHGYALNITDTIIRARYRNSRAEQEFMEPGKVYPFEMVLFPIGNLFKKGHRIRLDVSSSNFPRFDLNPNTGEPLGLNRCWQIADNTIHHGPEYPSHLLLPVIPA